MVTDAQVAKKTPVKSSDYKLVRVSPLHQNKNLSR